MTRSRTPLVLAALLTAPALVLTACGGSSSGGSTSAAPASSTASSAAPTETPQPSGSTIAAAFATTDCATPPPPTGADAAPSGGTTVDAVTVTGTMDTAPVVTIGQDAAPAVELVTEDVVVGDGPEAKPGATVTTEYCGVGLTSRALFDASWLRGEPATFPLDQVIPGWQEGIPGMKVGGRRLLVIPGDLAYGASPPPGSGILPDETLVFVVDLVKIG